MNKHVAPLKFKRGTKFIHAIKDEDNRGDSEALKSEDISNWNYSGSIPGSGQCWTRHYRYAFLSKTKILVEVWDSYCPVERGTFGRQRSALRARYNLVKDRGRDGKYKIYGTRYRWHWGGELAQIESPTKTVRLTSRGQLLEYQDSSRGEFNQRIVNYHDDNGVRSIRRWRGRYQDKQVDHRWRIYNSGGAITIRRTEDGTPLLDNGNFIEREFNSNDDSKSREVRFLSGRMHGAEVLFNRHGRNIGEKYFHHGVEIPGWVYNNPQSVSVEEVLDEENAEVRRAMLELQGFDVFLARCERKGMLTILDKDPDPRVGELIRIKLGDGEGGLYMLLKVKDGTLPKSYVLRVPPNMKTARQANAWTWNKKESEYAPSIER